MFPNKRYFFIHFPEFKLHYFYPVSAFGYFSLGFHNSVNEVWATIWHLAIFTMKQQILILKKRKQERKTYNNNVYISKIVAKVLQRDTLAPYLFIVCLDYVLRTSIDKIRENDFKLTKKRSRRHPAKTITYTDYADDIAILANTPNQAETQLHSLERAAAGIGLHVNVYKTEYMCFNQIGDISTLEGTSLKLVDKFTYLGSSVSSTKKKTSTHG